MTKYRIRLGNGEWIIADFFSMTEAVLFAETWELAPYEIVLV